MFFCQKYLNEYAVSKFIWIMFDNERKNSSSSYYVPYHCQFFIIPKYFQDRANIFEMYHNQIYDEKIRTTYFGTWTKGKTLKNIELDLYQRRFNRQGTNLTVLMEFLVIGSTSYFY